MRKLARVGRPASRDDSSARTSASRRPTPPGPRPRADAAAARASSRSSWGSCQASSAADVGEPADAVAQHAHATRSRRWRRRARDAGVEPVDQLGEATDEVDVGAADVVDGEARPRRGGGRHRSSRRRAGSGRARIRQVLWGKPCISNRARWAASSPHRTPDSCDPAGDPVEVVVGEVEPQPHGGRAGQIEHVRGGDAAAGQLDQRGGDGQQRVGAGEGAVGEPHAEAVSRVPAVPSTTSARPNPAEISGA